MEWLGPAPVPQHSSHRSAVLLSVCPDLDRLQSREHLLHTAGYRVVSASSLYAAQLISNVCKFDLVLLDQECLDNASVACLSEEVVSLLLPADTSDPELLSQIEDLQHALCGTGYVQ